MSPSVHPFVIATLPDNEGELQMLVVGWENPPIEVVFAQEIGSYALVHGDCSSSGLRLVHVSDKKRVICCSRCLLRISIPNEIKTYNDLMNFFTKDKSN